MPEDLSCQHLCQPNGKCSSWLEITQVSYLGGQGFAESVLDGAGGVGKGRCKLASIYFKILSALVENGLGNL